MTAEGVQATADGDTVVAVGGDSTSGAATGSVDGEGAVLADAGIGMGLAIAADAVPSPSM